MGFAKYNPLETITSGSRGGRMTKITLRCNYTPCDNIFFEKFGGKLYVEILIDRDFDEPTGVMLDKSSVAKLVEFLNGLELEE
jgi:hypothetical protein